MEGNKGCVLIVDDKEDYRNALKDMLKAGGYDVHLAESSQEALGLLEENPGLYRLAIVDCKLGKKSKMNGIELTRKVKEKYPEVKVVELTQFGNKGLYDEALDAGAIRFVHKTDDPIQIINIIDSLAEMEELDRQLKEPTPENYWLHQLITQCTSGISIIDRTYRILFISDSLKAMFPYKLNVGGICWVEFHRNETQKEPCHFCPIKSWFEEGKPPDKISSNLSPVGEGRDLCYFDLTGSPIKNKDGKIIGAVKIATNVTERERLIKAITERDIGGELKDRLRIILEGIQRLGGYDRLRIFILSDDWNKLEGMVQITGIEANIEYTANMDLLCKEHLCYWDHIKDEKVHLCESENPKIGPHPLYPNLKEWLQVPLIADKNPMGMIEIDNGITKRPLSGWDEDLIKKYARHAARSIAVAKGIQEVRDRAKKAEKINEKLRRAQAELKSTWELISARTAHKIGNPIFAIRGIIKNCKEKLKDLKDEDILGYMERIEKQIDRINALMNDIKEFGRKKTLSLKEVDINLLLKKAIEDILTGKDTEVEFNLEPSLPQVSVDAEELTDAFEEIVKNAVYFMQGGGRLTVVSSLTEDYIRIELSDTGSGISEDAKKHLFEPFFTTNPQGTGLGLAIVKKTIEEHNGTIKAENIDGGGARFIIHLPTKTKK